MISADPKNIPPKDAGNSAAPAPAGSNDVGLIIGVCIFLALIVWVVFGQTVDFSFVNFDDDKYIYENPVITNGLTPKAAASVFSWYAAGNWVPLTMLSHIVDWQFYGANAGGHHLTNVLLHAATAILLFLVLYKMTGVSQDPESRVQSLARPHPGPLPQEREKSGRRRALWCSAFVAAVFAIHPLRAESVAWVTERKDVLCGVFFILTLWAYWGYVRKPGSALRYLLALFLFALALMSKPVVVTLPVILLLLDYWPLRRLVWNGPSTFNSPLTHPSIHQSNDPPIQSLKRLLLEKIPFFLLSALFCGITWYTQNAVGAVYSASVLSPIQRLDHVPVSYAWYVLKPFWPANLCVLYPLRADNSFPEVLLASLFLVVLTVFALACVRKYPAVFTGWFWFLVMLLPVVGIFQAGDQAYADRYTYLPQIGLYIFLTWLAADLSVRLQRRGLVLASLVSVILAALVYVAHTQTSYWKDSETLWTRTLSCTTANPEARLNLGSAFDKEGRLDDAIAQYQEALKIAPNYALANHNLSIALLRQGRLDDAITQYQEALKYDRGRDAFNDHNNLGIAMFQKGQVDAAIIQFQKAQEYDPGDASVCNNLGWALLSKGRLEEAVTQYQSALNIQPDNVKYQCDLGGAIWMLTKSPGAKGEETLALAKNANQMAGGNSPLMLRALAAAYARCGNFPEAIETGKRALALAGEGQPPTFIDTLEKEIALYQAGSPLPVLNQTNATKP